MGQVDGALNAPGSGNPKRYPDPLMLHSTPDVQATPAPVPFPDSGTSPLLNVAPSTQSAMARFVLWGTYCDNALEKRTPFRQEHLSRLQQLKDAGTLITLGPTEESTHVFGIFEAESHQQVEELVHSDVYWREGIWTAVEVYPWIQAF
jgi:uncharacterized protein